MAKGYGSATNGVFGNKNPEIVPNWLAAGFALFLMGIATAAHAEIKVIDGDSYKLTVRLAGADTPELRGKCEREKKLAREARRFAEGFMAGKDWTMVHAGFGHFKRPLVYMIKQDGTWPRDGLP